jgi:hypothetical protein
MFRAKSANVFACKFVLIVIIFLSSVSLARAQIAELVDLELWERTPTAVALDSGKDIEFQFFVRVESLKEANGVILTAELPENIVFSSVRTDKGTCSFAARIITCNLSKIGAAGRITIEYNARIQIFAKPTAVGSATLTAQVTANEPDPNLANNSRTAIATIFATKSRKRVRFS